MTHIKRELDNCKNLVDFEKLIKDMTPTVGVLGGRRIKADGKSGTVSINDIVERFKQLSSDAKDKGSITKIAGTIKDLDGNATKKLTDANVKIDLTRVKRFFGGKVDRNFLDAAQGNKYLALAHEGKAIYDQMSPKIKDQITRLFPDVATAINEFIDAKTDDDARATFTKIKLSASGANVSLMGLKPNDPKRNCTPSINSFIAKIDRRDAEYTRILPKKDP